MGLVYVLVLGLYIWWSGLGVWTGLSIWVGAVVLTFGWRWLVSDVPPPLVAGSDWVGSAAGRASRVVPVYELTGVDVSAAMDGDGDPIAGAQTLRLVAAGGPRHELSVDLALLQSNPALWDLVFAGVSASAASGATISEDARAVLRGR